MRRRNEKAAEEGLFEARNADLRGMTSSKRALNLPINKRGGDRMNWDIAANIAEVITSVSLIFAIIQLIREKGSENTSAFFYLHQYLSQEQFSIARKKVRTELFKKNYEEWTEDDKEQANRVCASYDQAGILISGKVINPKTARGFLSSSWGISIIDQYECLDDFLSDYQTPAQTGKEFFHHFTWLYEQAKKNQNRG